MLSMKNFKLLFLALFLITIQFEIKAQSCLKAYFPMDGNANEIIGKYNGTVYGAKLDTDRFGRVDSCYRFNGTTDYISSSYPVPTGNSARSVSAWFYATDSTTNAGYGYNTIVSWGDVNTNNLFSIATAQHGALRIDGFANDVRTTPYVTDGKWHFVVVTHDGDTTRVYLDDSMIAKKGTKYNTVSSKLMIGTRINQKGQVMKGKIDDVKIFSCAITAQEIDSLYKLKAHTITKPTGCIKAYYPFSGNAGDSIGTYNGTVYGATLDSDKTGAPNSAYLFNGSSDYISSNYPVPTGNSERTVTAWFYATDSTTSAGYGYNTIVSWGDVTANSLFSIATAQHGAIRIDGFTNDVRTTKYVTDSKWHFVAVTHDGDTTRVYLDDSLIGKKGITYSTVSSKLIIGARINQSNQFMKGKIDEVRVFGCALTYKELDSIYQLNAHLKLHHYLSGNIKDCSKNALANTKVYLLKFNPADTTLSAVDSTLTDTFGHYLFSNVKDTSVYVYAVPDSAKYPGDVPTYFDTALAFQDAAAIAINKINTYANFSSFCGKNPGGNAVISGKVSLCYACKKSGAGLPAVGLKIILVDLHNNLQGITYTDKNGNFTFKGISIQNYKIWVDKPLVDNTSAPQVSLTTSSYNKTNLVFTLYPTLLEMQKDTTTGLASTLLTSNNIQIYPNPFSDILNLEGKFSGNEHLLVNITDLVGRNVFQKELSENINTAQLSLSQLKTGMYILTIQQGNKIVFREKVIRN